MGHDSTYNELRKEVSRLRAENETLRSEKARQDLDTERLSALILNLQMGVLVETHERKITRANQAFCNMFGIPKPDYILGANCDDAAEQAARLFEDPEKFVKGIRIILHKQQIVLNEELKMKDGRIFERDFIPVHQNGQFIGNMWIYRDITERKKLENDLKVSKENFENLYENAPIPYQALDKEGYFININNEWTFQTGYAKAEIIGKHFTDVLTTDSKARFEKNFPQLPRKGRIENDVLEIVRKDGKVLSANYEGTVTRDINGEMLHTNCVFQDITEKLKAEEALKESEERLKTLIHATPDIICFKDGEGRWLIANQADLELFDLQNVDYQGKTDAELAEHAHPLYKEAFLTCEETDEKTWQAQKISIGEEYIPKPNGPTKIYEVIKVPLFETDGSRKGLVVLGRDITERKNTEKALRDKEEELQEHVATKDKFFSIIAHDLRSPFNSILGFADLAMEESQNYEDEDLRYYISKVYQSAQKSSNLLENLLQWSRIETGRMPFSPESLKLKKTVEDTSELLKAGLEEKEIELKINIAPSTSVIADSNMLQTILRNLLSNAVKFTPMQGVIEISAIKSPHQTTITVQDSGPGLSAEQSKNLFKMEPQTASTNKTSTEGTGLGLVLCKEFVEKHGGEIRVESEAGKGARFIFNLPEKKH